MSITPSRLELEKLVVGHRVVLALAGEIDYGTVGDLRDAVDAAFADGAHEVWIDLSSVEFMDSTALHAVLDARRRAVDLGRRIAVICPPGIARRAFELAGIERELPLFASRDEAHRFA